MVAVGGSSGVGVWRCVGGGDLGLGIRWRRCASAVRLGGPGGAGAVVEASGGGSRGAGGLR